MHRFVWDMIVSLASLLWGSANRALYLLEKQLRTAELSAPYTVGPVSERIGREPGG